MAKPTKVIDTAPPQRSIFKSNIVGTTPMIMHRFSWKAWQELLLPSRDKNRAARSQELKHDPLTEYRESLYKNRVPGKTLFHAPNGMVHRCLQDVTVDVQGARKAEIGRQTSIKPANLDFYGIPKIGCHMVRSSGMTRAPDVRIRPIFIRWAIPNVEVEFQPNPLTSEVIAKLLSEAGTRIGLGDWRPQKRGDFGKFRLCVDDDEELREIVENEGIEPQQEAFDDPEYFDEDTEELLTWFNREILIREQEDQASGAVAPRRAKKEVV